MKKKALDVYVAIGSSAGGFEALSELVKCLPKKTGFYYFVAQHHALGEKSILAGLLGRNSKIEVVLVTIGMVFKPDVFYILPPELKIVVNKKRATVVTADINVHTPLPNADALFSELSTLKNSKTIAILLSGTGHDGTKGMRVVKEHGGITIAQFPAKAMFASMPQSAIDLKLVDYTLDVKDIAIKLVKLANAFIDGTYVSEEIPFDEIVKILHKEKQLDLSQYKEETINRLIQKRMDILNLNSMKVYAKYFKGNAHEVDMLNQEVLIGVTEFFRGHESFAVLKEHMKQKLLQKREYNEFRIWCVACSSGEEAYSLAILVNEISEELNKKFYIKIFASDIDDTALEKARAGEYQTKALESLESELIQKYFTKCAYGYRVVKALRDQVVFAHHNFLNNPPFINLDLISCRNVLIYLKSSAQRDVFAIFHYALNYDGVLFLGSSESTLSSLELFGALNKKHRIYEKKDETQQSTFPRQVINKNTTHLSTSRRQRMPKLINPQEIEKHLQEDLFDYFSNGSLIIDDEYNIVYKKGDIIYLNFADGLMSLNLFDNLDKALHYEVKKLIKSVQLSQMREVSKFIQIDSAKAEKFVQVAVQPFHMPESPSMLLLNFQDIESKELFLHCADLPSLSENNVVATLTSEVLEARTEIQSLLDELTFSKQNMALINKELQDANEKLQSTVEELETSNEELQSSNEELQSSLSSNRELQNRLSLILESSMDGIIGLDIYARHTFVNAKAAQMLGYSAEYLIGKESHRLWHHTKADGSYYPEEECPISSVLKSGKESRGKELFWRKDGSSFPVEYIRSPIVEDGAITGAVINFHDITHKKALEAKVKSEHEIMDTYIKISGLIIVFIDLNGIIVNINDAGLKVLGLNRKRTLGLNWFDDFIAEDIRTKIREVFFSVIHSKQKSLSHYINKILDKEKHEHLISWNIAAYKDEKGEAIGVIATGNDITKEEFLADELQKISVKYEQTFKTAQIGIAHVAIDGKWMEVNAYLCDLVGYTKEELLKLTFSDITYPDDLEMDSGYVNKLIQGEMDTYHLEKRYIHKNGNVIWIYLSMVLLRDSSNEPLYFVVTIQDITQMKMLMLEIESKKNQFETIVRFSPNPMMIYNEEGEVLMINEAFKNLTGYTLQDIPTIEQWKTKLKGAKNMIDKEMLQTLFEEHISIHAGEVNVLTKSDEHLMWIQSLAPLGTIFNSKKSIIYVATDITQMHANEELMLAQSRQAAMGDMISMIAHQWRQPLSVISMVGNNLRADLELGSEITPSALYEVAAVLEEQTISLSRTIDDFRTFFKPEKEKEKVSLCIVYEKLRNMIGKALENNQITLEFVNDCNVEFYTFTNELIQVFVNLLNNSKDAVKEKNIKDGRIDIVTTFTKDLITIEIVDNAGGIDEEVLAKLGEPYVSTKSKNGTGLGIYMSKMILEKHFGGGISWKNCNKGVCFTLELPIEDLQVEEGK